MTIASPIPPKDDSLAAFPRGLGLPSQSPLFWVQQKDRYLRQLMIRDIEAVTGRRLIVYFANRYEVGAEIQQRDVLHFAELFGDLNQDRVDLLVETNGGSTDATEAIISLIQSSLVDFRVVVVNAAKSNGTLLALAAQCIVMGAISELGPIEPAIQGIPCSILDSPEIAKSNFPLHMLGKFALQQSRSLATSLLTRGMMTSKTKVEIEAAVNALAGRHRFPSLGSVIDHREALAIGLNVTYLPPDDELWRRFWLLYCMYDHDARSSGLLKMFEGRSRSLAIAAPSPPSP
jgi:hypothetical protein